MAVQIKSVKTMIKNVKISSINARLKVMLN